MLALQKLKNFMQKRVGNETTRRLTTGQRDD
jgi:hypothetical protein